MMKKFNNKNFVDILSYFYFNGYFDEINSLSPIVHLITNYPFLKDWCSHELGYPENNERVCGIIHGLSPFNKEKKDFLDQIWGHSYFYKYFYHE